MAEALFGLIHFPLEEGSFHEICIAQSTSIVSHLFFANDYVIFGHAREEEATIVKDSLLLYEVASGQDVNFDKTTISFSKGVGYSKR